MTNFSANQIAQLTAVVTGGEVKRAATTDAAVKRFLNVFTDRVGEPLVAASQRDILNAPDIEAARSLVCAAIGEADKEQEALLADCRQDDGQAGATYAAEAETVADEPAIATKGGAGLARLQASANAEALRAEALSESQRALCEASSRRKAFEVAQEPAQTAKPSKPAKAKAPKPEGAATRSRVDLSAKITAVSANPKKEGSRSHARFACYKVGQTVQEFINACAAAGYPASEAKADISWDRRKGFIQIDAG